MAKSDYQEAVDKLSESFGNIQAGRATPAMFDELSVMAYGSPMKLQELASITVPEPQMLVIQPWDKSVIKQIETAIRESELQLNPVVDGEQVRVSVPQLTEEKRIELVKLMHEKAEEARIRVRRTREEKIKEVKEKQKSGEISEDDMFRLEKEIQKEVDGVNADIKDMSEHKEADLMKV